MGPQTEQFPDPISSPYAHQKAVHVEPVNLPDIVGLHFPVFIVNAIEEVQSLVYNVVIKAIYHDWHGVLMCAAGISTITRFGSKTKPTALLHWGQPSH